MKKDMMMNRCSTVRVSSLKMMKGGNMKMCSTMRVSSLMMNRGSHSMRKNNLIMMNNSFKKKNNSMVMRCNTVRRTTLKKKCTRIVKASMKKSKTVERMMSKVTRVKSQWSMC